MAAEAQARVTVRINADRVSWLDDNPDPKGPPVARVATFGEVHSIPKDQADRLRQTTTRRFYTNPATGVPRSLAREEPAVVDAAEDEAEQDEARRRADARIAELQAEIDRVRAERPPAPAPAPPTGPAPVTLTPATTGTTLIVGPDGPRTAEEAAAAGLPAPVSTAPPAGDTQPLSERNASELVQLLRNEPNRADEVESAEQSRREPRSSVLEAVARARAG